MVIPLEPLLPEASSDLPGNVFGASIRDARRDELPAFRFPIWSCSAWGLPCLVPLPNERCALTTPFHPYPTRLSQAVYSLLHFPSRHRALPLASMLLVGVRTFLLSARDPNEKATIRNSPAPSSILLHSWPARALVDGTSLNGLWFNRSREHNARTRGKGTENRQAPFPPDRASGERRVLLVRLPGSQHAAVDRDYRTLNVARSRRREKRYQRSEIRRRAESTGRRAFTPSFENLRCKAASG